LNESTHRAFVPDRATRVHVPLVSADPTAGEQHGDAYRAVNRRRVVPHVLEDGTAIGEVPAIWRYFEEIYPTKPLPGATPKRRAELEEITRD
jgi:glutathione S-transferase